MSKQPVLLSVQPDSPSKASRITEFKKQHRIWTHRADFLNRADNPWSALLMPKGVTEETAVQCIADYCRLLDESNQLGAGEGELSAIRTLCQLNDIPCDL